MVEHDEDTMRAADCIVDIGPGAGEHGGQLVAMGTAEELMKNRRFHHRSLSERKAKNSGAYGVRQEANRLSDCQGGGRE